MWRVEIFSDGAWRVVPPADYSLSLEEAKSLAEFYANSRITAETGAVITVGEAVPGGEPGPSGGYSSEASEAGESEPGSEAKRIGDQLGVDWSEVSIDQFARGLEVEKEHADVTRGDLLMTGRIALAHLKEDRYYYSKLTKAGLEAGESSQLTVGDEVEIVKPHGSMKPGMRAKIAVVDGTAYGIQMAGGAKVHRWYTSDELRKIGANVMNPLLLALPFLLETDGKAKAGEVMGTKAAISTVKQRLERGGRQKRAPSWMPRPAPPPPAIVSTPKKHDIEVIIRPEQEPYSRTGVAWRAYQKDGTPLYLGGETEDEVRKKVLGEYREAKITVERASGAREEDLGDEYTYRGEPVRLLGRAVGGRGDDPVLVETKSGRKLTVDRRQLRPLIPSRAAETGAADYPDLESALLGAQSRLDATHMAKVGGQMFIFSPTSRGYVKRQLFRQGGNLHWPQASTLVADLPAGAMTIHEVTKVGWDPEQVPEMAPPRRRAAEASPSGAEGIFDIFSGPKYEILVKYGPASVDQPETPHKTEVINTARNIDEARQLVHEYRDGARLSGSGNYYWYQKIAGVREGGEPLQALENFERFSSWLEVLTYAKTHEYLLYQAPMDVHPHRVRVVKVFSNGKIRLDPMSRDADPFTADRTHFDRMLKPITRGAEPLRARAGRETERSGARENPVEAANGSSWAKITRDPKKFGENMDRAEAIGPIKNAEDVFKLLSPELAKEDQEVFLVLPLDIRGQLRCPPIEVHRGERSRVGVSVPDVLRAVVEAGGEGFVVVHNHPTTKATPSEADRDLTKAIRKGADAIELAFVDHVVIGTTRRRADEYYSFEGKKLYKSWKRKSR